MICNYNGTGTFPMLNGTEVGSNVMELFSYANCITNENFTGFVIIAFFLVVLIGSMLAQQRYTGRVVAQFAFMAASFSTLGLSTIFMIAGGFNLLAPGYFFGVVVVTIVCFIWVALSPD
jgi:hypothetical protein